MLVTGEKLYVAGVDGKLDHTFRVNIWAQSDWDAQRRLHHLGYSVRQFPTLATEPGHATVGEIPE